MQYLHTFNFNVAPLVHSAASHSRFTTQISQLRINPYPILNPIQRLLITDNTAYDDEVLIKSSIPIVLFHHGTHSTNEINNRRRIFNARHFAMYPSIFQFQSRSRATEQQTIHAFPPKTQCCRRNTPKNNSKKKKEGSGVSPLHGVGVGNAVEALPADVVGHGDLELVAEAREILAEGLAAGRQGARGRRQGAARAARLALRVAASFLAQAPGLLLRPDQGHLVLAVDFEVGDHQVDYRDYEGRDRDRHRVNQVHVDLGTSMLRTSELGYACEDRLICFRFFFLHRIDISKVLRSRYG